MTKRQLTKQQRKRIEKNQLNASAKTDVLEALIEEDSENVSGEKLGIVTASYGAQIDVEETKMLSYRGLYTLSKNS